MLREKSNPAKVEPWHKFARHLTVTKVEPWLVQMALSGVVENDKDLAVKVDSATRVIPTPMASDPNKCNIDGAARAPRSYHLTKLLFHDGGVGGWTFTCCFMAGISSIRVCART